MSAVTTERTTLPRPVVNDMETLKHIAPPRAAIGPGTVALCGHTATAGRSHGPWHPGHTTRVCRTCEAIAQEFYS